MRLALLVLSLGVWLAGARPGLAQQRVLPNAAPRTEAPRLAPAPGPHAAARIDEVEPNNDPAEAQTLPGPLPISVEGTVETADVGALGIDLDGDEVVDEDFEDFYRITTTEPGLRLRLDGLTADVDVYLIDEDARRSLDAGATVGVIDEDLDIPGLPVGTYLIAVSIFDPEPEADATAYTLTVEAASAVPADEVEPNNDLADAQALTLGPLDFLFGTIDVDDVGTLGVGGDDLEDLFLLTLPGPGLRVTLTLHGADCDLYLANPDTGEILGQSNGAGIGQESIDLPELGAGTYLLAVSIFDDDPVLDTATFYLLTLENAVSTAAEDAPAVPEGLALGAYPNPFTEALRIRFTLPAAAAVRLDVFDLRGRRVRTLLDGRLPPGAHTAAWDGRDAAGAAVPAGVYLYRLRAGTATLSQTVVRVR